MFSTTKSQHHRWRHVCEWHCTSGTILVIGLR